MKYLFILGRNIELSISEINSFFEAEKNKFNIISLVNNGLLVNAEKKIDFKRANKLGGIVSIGEVLASGSIKEIMNQLEKINLYNGTKNKINYTLQDFSGDYKKILDYIKRNFKKEKLKASEKKSSNLIRMQNGKKAFKNSSNFIDEKFFIFKNYFGRIFWECNYKEIEERDMKKPVRREALSISPRIAKILINLSQVKQGETLLDPFCGIGTILQEALLQNIEVIGIDKDRTAIEGARKNLEWFGVGKEKYKLIVDDSSKTKIGKVNAIATEPDLGNLQRKIPSNAETSKIIERFEGLMINVLNNLKNFVMGRIAFTAPYIKTEKGRIQCDFEKISKKTSLKLLPGFPIHEFREDTIIGRSIVVLKK